MMKMSIMAACAGLALSAAAHAQQYIMAVDSSTGGGVHLLDPATGSVYQQAFIPDVGASYTMATPKHALQVGNEIWVSDQVNDEVYRFDLQGAYIATITGGMDNIRGMALIDGFVYVTNDGSGNGATPDSLVKFDTSGNNVGVISVAGTTPSPFDVLAFQGDMLVSSSSANDIYRYTIPGVPVGIFHNSTGLNFAQQMDFATNGDVLVAGFSSPAGIHRLDPATGNIIATYAAAGPRGVLQLASGNILWTNSAGAHALDPATGISTQVATGGYQYLDWLTLGGPTACYANCDESTSEPILNVADFSCFLTKFAAGEAYANCDESTTEPTLNVADFSCFLTKFAAGCP